MKYTLSLKKNKEFRYIIKKGKFARGKYINMYVSKAKDKSTNFLGICVSKKNGNSVCRNKLKRWGREAYKNIEKNLKIGINIVVIYKKSITIDNTDYLSIFSDMKICFKELDMYE